MFRTRVSSLKSVVGAAAWDIVVINEQTDGSIHYLFG